MQEQKLNKEVYKFRGSLVCHYDFFYYSLQIKRHNSGLSMNQTSKFLINWVLKPGIIRTMSCRYNMMCRARCSWPVNYDIICQTIHGSTDYFYNEAWKTCPTCFYILLKSLTPTPLWYENVHRNHAETIGHCDVTIASGKLIYRWRHKKSTAVYILKSSEAVKCGFTSTKTQKSHKWSVHRIHGARNV